MKFLLIALSATLLTCGYSQTVKINTENATINFNYVSELTKGTFSNVSANIDLNTLDLLASKIEGTAKINTLSTGNVIRDKRLLQKTYFNAVEFPIIKFASKEIKKIEDHYEAIGTMSIKGFTRSVTFIININDNTLVLKTSVFADDFGVAVKPGRETSLVEIEVVLSTI